MNWYKLFPGQFVNCGIDDRMCLYCWDKSNEYFEKIEFVIDAVVDNEYLC